VYSSTAGNGVSGSTPLVRILRYISVHILRGIPMGATLHLGAGIFLTMKGIGSFCRLFSYHLICGCLLYIARCFMTLCRACPPPHFDFTSLPHTSYELWRQAIGVTEPFFLFLHNKPPLDPRPYPFYCMCLPTGPIDQGSWVGSS